MSGIRYLIALLFLFAGLESELRASASQATPASCNYPSSDIITNLNSKTSVDKMTKTAPGRIPGILAERVIVPASRFILMPQAKPQTLARASREADAFCVSGCSPPV